MNGEGEGEEKLLVQAPEVLLQNRGQAGSLGEKLKAV